MDGAVEMIIDEATDAWWVSNPYHLVRFYEETDSDLQSAVPQADYWGAAQQVETEYLCLNYNPPDARLITTIAPQLDADLQCLNWLG